MAGQISQHSTHRQHSMDHLQNHRRLKNQNPYSTDSIHNQQLYKDEETAEGLAQSFHDIRMTAYKQYSPLEKLIDHKTTLTNQTQTLPSTQVHSSRSTIRNIIKHLPNNKAPGSDNITTDKLKNLPRKPIVQLSYIYKACLQITYFSWKIAKIISIPKPGKPETNITSYRPISLLDTFGKILEIIIQQQRQKSNLIIP